MAWYNKILAVGAEKIVDSVGDVLDNLFTSDEERAKVALAMQKIKDKTTLSLKEMENQIEINAQEQITDRWKTDNDGNFLTRSIRPITLIYLTIAVTLLAITDGNVRWHDDMGKEPFAFVIKDSWVELFKWAYMAVLSAFFVGKSIERAKAGVA